MRDNNELWAKYRNLALWGMNKYYGVKRVNGLGADAEQVAWEIINIAVSQYDESKGASLASYIVQRTRATKYFVNAVQARRKGMGLLLSFDERTDSIDKREKSDFETAGMLSDITGRSSNVVWRHVVNGDTFAEIGEDLGLTRERVRVVFDDAIERLRKRELGAKKAIAMSPAKYKHKHKHRG